MQIAGLEGAHPSELGSDPHPDTNPPRPDEPGKKERIKTLELHEDQGKRRLLEERLAPEIAGREGMDLPFTGKLDPGRLCTALHATCPRRCIPVAAGPTGAPEKSSFCESGKKRRVLGIGVDIVDFVMPLHDDGIEAVEDRSPLVFARVRLFRHDFNLLDPWTAQAPEDIGVD